MKGGKPEGLGKWTHVSDAIEGEWKDGKLNGKAVFYRSSKHREEFEVEEGKRDGRSIHYWKGGRRLEREFLMGELHGREREYNKDGSIYEEYAYEFGNRVRRVR